MIANLDRDIETITRLADLLLFEYDRTRIEEVLVSTLDETVKLARKKNNTLSESHTIVAIEPWSEPVSGSELLTILSNTIKRLSY
jgi:hypothetical protein